MAANKFPCKSCGAELVFEPGSTTLKCPYCNTINQIELSHEPLEEIDYTSTLQNLEDEGDHVEIIESRCQSCHAEVQLDEKTASQNCPFCGSGLIAHNISKRLIKPRAIVPFAVPLKVAREKFRKWLASRWFAPSSLRHMASVEGDATYTNASGLAGLYLPYWTYDCRTTTPYTGQRGDHYYVTVPRTRMINGKSQTVMERERRTRWSLASGNVANTFDDVLVPASTSIPGEQLAALGEWNLSESVVYQDDFLSGFRAESYTIGLPQGFVGAQRIMETGIRAAICRDIGGDEQRITSMAPQYLTITFKHLLLPIWVSAYRFNGVVHRFLVNGQTGEIFGQRPYSAWKIAAACVAMLCTLAVLILLLSTAK